MDFCIIFGVGNGCGFRSLWSDVGTEIVVETGLAFDFGPLASSIRRLIYDALRDRVDRRVEQQHGQLNSIMFALPQRRWPYKRRGGDLLVPVRSALELLRKVAAAPLGARSKTWMRSNIEFAERPC